MNLENSEWKPPSEPGLRNSDPIIPSYYLKKINFLLNGKEHETRYLNIEYLNVIKDDLRNFRKLNKYQLSFIKYNLLNCDKNEIIELMNECLNSALEVIEVSNK